jgi:F-type H+-transporting ATPase subunit a
MGEHSTWLDWLDRSESMQGLGDGLGREWTWVMFDATHFTLIHVLFAIVAALFVLYGALRFKAAVTGKGTAGLIPPARFNIRNFFELICDTTFGLMVGVMGEKNAKKYFPFIASFAFFILFCNLMALLPGMGVATTTLKTNLALSGIVFLSYNYFGIREHGLSYLKHFLGPIPWLAPLMLPIEIISHLARPASLAIRLMGNMFGDHKVVFSFFVLFPLLLPIPFLLLGLLVAVIQTLVFCLLSMVYISMAVAHDH